jgi:ERCC4-type nuclease
MQNKIKYKIIIDTREKQIDHIEKAFKKNNIDYIRRTLPIGDYIIEGSNGHVPNVVIERKASIDEITSNLLDTATKDENGNNRFTRELIRAKKANKKFILLIEDEKFYINLLTGNYRSKVNSKAAKGMIMSLEAKYPNLNIVWMEKREVASYIHSILYYCLREDLK